MTFLKLRNITYKLINEHNKEENAFFYLIDKYSKIGRKTLINQDNIKIDFNLKDYMGDLNDYITGKPIRKIINYLKIFNLKIYLNYNVLIPRLETEEFIFKLIKKLNGDEKVLDLCCGSGVIGLALKKHHKNLDMFMSDIDEEALKASIFNAAINNLDVKIIKSDLFKDINEKFDVIISNPPYINKNIKLNDSILFNEPYNSLFANNNGLEFYEKIIPQLKNHLIKDSKYFIAFEIGENQSNSIKTLLKKENFNSITSHDINKKDRFIFSIKK